MTLEELRRSSRPQILRLAASYGARNVRVFGSTPNGCGTFCGPSTVFSRRSGAAAGLRHILVHHYFEIDAEQVWKVVEHDLASLRQKVIDILA